MPLTDPAVRTAKPAEKPYRLADGGGLYLEVYPNGSKYWRLKYRHAGKEKRIAMGVYPGVSLKDARELRDAAKALLLTGANPADTMTKREKTRAARLKTENSFEALAREWHEAMASRWKPVHADKVLSSLEAEAFPSLGNRPIAEITAPEVLDVLRSIERRGALDTASRTAQRLAGIFRFAIQTGRANFNPAADMQGALKSKPVTHRTALSREELPEFMKSLETSRIDDITRAALALTLLTAQRTGEIIGARWEEFDLAAGLWRIPGPRMKMQQPHTVPLSRQALAVLESLRAISGAVGLLFPGRMDRSQSISNNTMLYALYRMGWHKRATVHGFRSVFSTIANESGFNPDAIERQLAHRDRNAIRSAYNRGDYLEERKKMMQWWADFLDGMKAGGNVIPLFKTA